MVATRRSTRAATASAAESTKPEPVVSISAKETVSQKSHYSVFLYVPNLIGKIPALASPKSSYSLVKLFRMF